MKILYTVLDMGLGHATRSLPVIRALERRGCEVVVGSAGDALELLSEERPGQAVAELPAYAIRYGRRGADLPGMLRQGPRMLRTVRAEHEALLRLAEEHAVERVVSDHRYGCWHPDLPSFFLTHQVRFAAPGMLRWLEGLGVLFNRRYHRHFQKVLIPDVAEGREGLLSGRLSRLPSRDRDRYVRIGPLADLTPTSPGSEEERLDLFVSISGPEPQRTVLEHLLLRQIREVGGKREVALGRPGEEDPGSREQELEVHGFLGRTGISDRMRRARVVVSRSGYSTLMELAAVGGKALLIPTPGQTEQEYLARRVAGRGWIHTVPQGELDLKRDLSRAMEREGMPVLQEAEASAERACDVILGGT